MDHLDHVLGPPWEQRLCGDVTLGQSYSNRRGEEVEIVGESVGLYPFLGIKKNQSGAPDVGTYTSNGLVNAGAVSEGDLLFRVKKGSMKVELSAVELSIERSYEANR